MNKGLPPEFIVVPMSWMNQVKLNNAAKIPKNKYKQYMIGFVACFFTPFSIFLSISLLFFYFYFYDFTGFIPPISSSNKSKFCYSLDTSFL